MIKDYPANSTTSFICFSGSLAGAVFTAEKTMGNALNFIDAPALAKEAERWHKFQADVEREFLRPKQSEMKWQ